MLAERGGRGGSDAVKSGVRMFLVDDAGKVQKSTGRVNLGTARAVWSPPAFEQDFSFKDEARKLGIYVGGLHYIDELW